MLRVAAKEGMQQVLFSWKDRMRSFNVNLFKLANVSELPPSLPQPQFSATPEENNKFAK